MEKVTIEISKDVYEKLKDELGENSELRMIQDFSDFVGKKLFLRTVTYHILGKVIKQVGNLLLLENASWVADSGRLMDFIKNGEASEVEPVGEWFVNASTIVDGCVWQHELPKKQI